MQSSTPSTDIPDPSSIGPYKILEPIGSGAFATVYKALHTITDCIVALKAISKRSLRSMQEFELLQREVNLMKTMDHPFIACFYEVLDDDVNFYLAIELVGNGSLLDHINANMGLDERMARRIFAQIISVLDYLHTQKRVVHRDLKAENVLLDHHMNVRVVDFGLSKNFSKANPFLQTTCGSPAYVSPEIIREEPYTAAADAWSAGVLLYASVCGGLPFNGDNLTLMLQAILTTTPVIPSQMSPQLRSLILGLLAKDPRTRLTVGAAVEHPWLVDAEDRLDFNAIALFKVHDVNELDSAVLAEMRVIGYDVSGLLQEIKTVTINARTAAYKMLRRKRMVEEFDRLWRREIRKTDRRKSTEALPALNRPASVRGGSQPDLIITADPVKGSIRIRKRYDIRMRVPTVV
jgi:serine/threonine protein kinase